MGVITRTVRRNAQNPLKRYRREEFQPPKWLVTVGMWVGTGAICLLAAGILVYSVINRGDTAPTATASASAARVQPIQIDPKERQAEIQQDEATTGDSTASDGAQFISLAMTNLQITGAQPGSLASVPQGAVELATAAAPALVSGQWGQLPTSSTPPPLDPALVNATVSTDDLSVKDPATNGTDIYEFHVPATKADGQKVDLTMYISYANGTFRLDF